MPSSIDALEASDFAPLDLRADMPVLDLLVRVPPEPAPPQPEAAPKPLAQGLVCFTAGTRILTTRGDLPVEQIMVGDLIITRDNGLKPVLWIGSQQLNADALNTAPHLRPVLLKAACFSLSADMAVSPNHGIVLRHGDRGGDEVLYRASHLAQMPGGGARVLRGCRQVSYYHFLLDQHEVVFANGASSESLCLSADAFRALGKARLQIRDALPELFDLAMQDLYLPARRYSSATDLPEHLKCLDGVPLDLDRG